MVRELILIPFRVSDTVVGGLAGLVRSRIGGGRSAPMSSADLSSPPPRYIPPAPQTQPADRDASNSGWDEDAPVPPGGSSPDDLVITDRVKSELFAVADAPKGELNLNVENGVLFIRGHIEDRDQIDDLVTLAEGIEGVVRVENLISS
jgi:hypothetical protein